MAGIKDKRKRSREGDVVCDSTPLSKRINNLHLTNYEEAQNVLTKQLMHKDALSINNHTSQISVSRELEGVVVEELRRYNPELNESQNPFYYSMNKLLHELHLERMKRCTV